MRNSLWTAIGLSVAMAAFPLSPAAAQTASVEEIDRSHRELVELFASGVYVTNFRGEPGASGSWHMVRAVSGATVTRRCVLTLQAPEILDSSPNVTPARHYNLDFATVQNFTVVREGTSPSVLLFTADHMASDEAGIFTFSDWESPHDAADEFRFMVSNCRSRN